MCKSSFEEKQQFAVEMFVEEVSIEPTVKSEWMMRTMTVYRSTAKHSKTLQKHRKYGCGNELVELELELELEFSVSK